MSESNGSQRRFHLPVAPALIGVALAVLLGAGWWLATTPRSLPEIGRKFGGRDHTTVIHAVRKVEELVADDPAFREDVDLLKRLLQG